MCYTGVSTKPEEERNAREPARLQLTIAAGGGPTGPSCTEEGGREAFFQCLRASAAKTKTKAPR